MTSEAGPVVHVERALLSVDDKSGLEEFGRGLAALGTELWATGGTRTALTRAGVEARSAEELTGIGSWFGGRVKTLHPGILGGILAPRTEAGRAELAERGLRSFELVVVNFYPFERHLAEHPDATDREEFVDIGGVTLARAAAKNHAAVAVLTSPADYGDLLAEMRDHAGSVSAATRARLAQRAFERVAAYDAAIAEGLFPSPSGADMFPETVVLRREALRLRYGENPHQKAAVYAPPHGSRSGFAPRAFEVLKGGSLSYTNLLDLDTALAIVAEFQLPAAAVVKHATPCGVAEGRTLAEAIGRAIATDPVARFGCAVAVNRPLGAEDPAALHGVFVDLLGAPEFDPGARAALEHRAKLKVVPSRPAPAGGATLGGEERVRTDPHPGGGPASAHPRGFPAGHLGARLPRGALFARFRMAGGPPREVERDRARVRPADGGDRLGPADARKGRRARLRGRRRTGEGRGARLRRFLPVRGRGRGGRPRRRHRHPPARRKPAGPRGDRGRREGGGRDVLHGVAGVPPLTGARLAKYRRRTLRNSTAPSGPTSRPFSWPESRNRYVGTAWMP